jgi:hypothetical protein
MRSNHLLKCNEYRVGICVWRGCFSVIPRSCSRALLATRRLTTMTSGDCPHTTFASSALTGVRPACGRRRCFAAIGLDSAILRPYDLTSPIVIDFSIVALFSTHSTRNRASDFRDTVAKDDHRSPRSTKGTSFSASVRPGGLTIVQLT